MINSKDYDFKLRIIDVVIKVPLSTVEGLNAIDFSVE